MYESLPLREIIMNYECGERDKEVSPDPPGESAFLIFYVSIKVFECKARKVLTFLALAKSNAPRRARRKIL